MTKETTSLGVRICENKRWELDRKIIKIDTKWGQARLKVAYLDGKNKKVAPEYEDCKKIAKKYNLPVKEVYENLLSIGRTKYLR